MNKRQIAEKIYQTLNSQRFSDWYTEGRNGDFDRHISDDIPAPDKETILKWIENNMVDAEQALTEQEQNVIKDILKIIGRDATMDKQFAKALGLSLKNFDNLTDTIFKKLGNGRVNATGKNVTGLKGTADFDKVDPTGGHPPDMVG